MDFEDDIMGSFIEDTQEHLAGIEASLMDMEQAGENADQELVNTVFRAAHSIKGGAGFLGLDNVCALAHKLENLLHMVRSGEIVPDHRNVSSMLKGFDLLRTLVQNAAASNDMDISEALEQLSVLTREHLQEEKHAHLTASVLVPLPGGGPGFSIDLLSLEHALQGGKYLYMVEYDLIHDVHARGKTPLDVIATMEASGLMLDCRMDLATVGDLDAPLCNAIPFYVLFATIVEPDVVSYLFALDASRIKPVDPSTLIPADPATTAAATPVRLAMDASPDDLEAARLEALHVLDREGALVLELTGDNNLGAAVIQFLCAAHRSAHARGQAYSVRGADSPECIRRLVLLGFPSGTAPFCTPGACPLLAGA
jgi:two-component system, chemotaxis family, sensor kinase CheA